VHRIRKLLLLPCRSTSLCHLDRCRSWYKIANNLSATLKVSKAEQPQIEQHGTVEEDVHKILDNIPCILRPSIQNYCKQSETQGNTKPDDDDDDQTILPASCLHGREDQTCSCLSSYRSAPFRAQMKSGKVEEGDEEEENKLTSLACKQEIHNNNLPPGAASDGRRAPLALDGSNTTTPTALVRMLKGRDDAGVLGLPVR